MLTIATSRSKINKETLKTLLIILYNHCFIISRFTRDPQRFPNGLYSGASPIEAIKYTYLLRFHIPNVGSYIVFAPQSDDLLPEASNGVPFKIASIQF